jgi:hypothetical protein
MREHFLRLGLCASGREGTKVERDSDNVLSLNRTTPKQIKRKQKIEQRSSIYETCEKLKTPSTRDMSSSCCMKSGIDSRSARDHSVSRALIAEAVSRGGAADADA